MPYITIHAQRKARAIVKLIQPIELTNDLFLDTPNNNNNDEIEDGGVVARRGNEKMAEEDDDIDSDDEMDDEGEEVLVEGGLGSTSLVSFDWVG